MSIELPEAQILAGQMDGEIIGKRIGSCSLQDYVRLQRVGFLNKDIRDFDRLVGGKIEAVVSRGNVIRVKLDNRMNLLIAPEYGGRVLYHKSEDTIPKKHHLKVDFTDRTALTVRLTSMGVIQAVDDTGLGKSYVYRRDFSEKLSPSDEAEFTLERFSELLTERSQQLKQVLVGKDAVVVGISNSTFQDVIYRAGLHPKRKGTDLSDGERRALYDAMKLVIKERIRLRGKDQFVDLYGNRGGYTPVMGPNMKQQACPVCGTLIERLSIGGGQVYICPKCQKLSTSK